MDSIVKGRTMEWKDIESAPTDGTVIRVKRVHGGGLVFEGPAQWRMVRFPAQHDPQTGETYAVAQEAPCWMRVDGEYRVPQPTHWQALR